MSDERALQALIDQVKATVGQFYVERGRVRIPIQRLVRAGVADEEGILAALLALEARGYVQQDARLRCPAGHVWDGPVPETTNLTCPRCFETFPADEVDIRLSFKVSPAWEEALAQKKSPSRDHDGPAREPPGGGNPDEDAELPVSPGLLSRAMAWVGRWLAAEGKQMTEPNEPSPTTLPASKARILFLAANPETSGRLALDEEARDIEAKIRTSQHRDMLELKTRWAVRTDDLLQALNEDRPVVVHFSGHGSGAGGIVLHEDGGGKRFVKGAALGRLFQAIRDDIRVVVLNACYSEEQAMAIAEVIDCVVGMSDSVGDESARRFSAGFYRALGFGRSVQNAFDQGLAAIALDGLDDEDVPVLHVRDGVDASQVVLADGSPPDPL